MWVFGFMQGLTMRCGEWAPYVFLYISYVLVVLRGAQGHPSPLRETWETMSPIQQAHTECLPNTPPSCVLGTRVL